MDNSDIDVAEFLVAAGQQFVELCGTRARRGAEEYGEFAFLQNDVIRMMQEELADIANYAQMQFIKLHLLQQMLVEKLETDQPVDLKDVGIGTFRGAKEGWNK